MTKEYITNNYGITNVGWQKGSQDDLKKNEKCTGESGDIGDIAKNVKIAMQKFT